MGVIVQEYGPIYGEVVNGTVQGRPNGSVYVPITNTIEISIAESYRFIRNIDTPNRVSLCNSDGTTAGARYFVTAESQDLASNIQVQVYDDADCTNLIAYLNVTAGIFNASGFVLISEETIVADAAYYCRAQLFNNSSAVATSSVIPLVGVVVE